MSGKPGYVIVSLIMLMVVSLACGYIAPSSPIPPITQVIPVTLVVPVTRVVPITQIIPVTQVVSVTLVPSPLAGVQPLNWQAVGGQWNRKDDIVVGTAPGEREGRYIASEGASWQDYTFSGQLKFHRYQCHEIAILLRVQDVKPQSPGEQDQGHYYQISLYDDKRVILYRIENGATALMTVKANLVADRWYTFKAEVDGTNIRFYLDDQIVFEYAQLTEYRYGGVGLKIFGETTGYFQELHLQLAK